MATLGSCWIPTQKPKPDGYVQLGYYKKPRVYLHRIMYETLVGPIPDNMYLDHLCRERSCCNPSHLEPVTNQENIKRGRQGQYQKDKTHCKRGHEYNEENTYTYRRGKVMERHCRKCCNQAQKKYMQRRKQSV